MAIKKKFIDVEIPILGEETSVLGTPETLNKQTIKLDLSRKLRGRGLDATFVMFKKENKLVAYPKSLVLMRAYIQRAMRKRANYVEDSFDVQCTDIKARIKPFLITRKKVSRAVRNNLRRTAKEFLIEYVKDKTFLELAGKVIYNDIQKEMHPRLKKVYPLSLCEIRVLETTEIEKANLEMPKREEKMIEQEAKEEKTQIEEIEEALKAKKAKEEVKEEIVTQADEIEQAQKEKAEKKPKKSKAKKEEAVVSA
jgi:hypothetical protein